VKASSLFVCVCKVFCMFACLFVFELCRCYSLSRPFVKCVRVCMCVCL